MSWRPNFEEQKYIRLIQSMCLDAAMGQGVADRETFVANLEMIAKQIREFETRKRGDYEQTTE